MTGHAKSTIEISLWGWVGDYAQQMPRVRRRWKLGWGFRVAVLLLWPFMQVFTKRDWQGTEELNADPGGIIIAVNHISWFDPFVVAHVLWNNDRPPRVLAKESVFRIPIAGAIVRSAGQVRVYRETANAVDAVRDAITDVEAGECVVVYPEGTITRDPGLWPMEGKTGAARIALASGRPIIPMAQWGAQEVMAPYRKRLHLLPRKTMRVRVGAPVDLSDLAARPLDGDTLHVATERVMDAITALLAQIRQETPPEERIVFERNPPA
jgi:1-acyl-sn-glycerol-3-phosphate acyltransferase